MRGAGFDTPTQENLEALFDVMHRFVRNYLKIYYPRNAAGANSVRNDPETLAWLEELNARVPNGVGVTPENVTWDELARMLASQLYLVTVQHEILGSFMWNYQLWTHRQPARIYADFQREPLDVYQRLVNANYILNVRRRALMDDFSHFALDYRCQGGHVSVPERARRAAGKDGQPTACGMAGLPTRFKGQHQRLMKFDRRACAGSIVSAVGTSSSPSADPRRIPTSVTET